LFHDRAHQGIVLGCPLTFLMLPLLIAVSALTGSIPAVRAIRINLAVFRRD
jgi:hypothetical protein